MCRRATNLNQILIGTTQLGPNSSHAGVGVPRISHQLGRKRLLSVLYYKFVTEIRFAHLDTAVDSKPMYSTFIEYNLTFNCMVLEVRFHLLEENNLYL
jgi:hypothetical protein